MSTCIAGWRWIEVGPVGRRYEQLHRVRTDSTALKEDFLHSNSEEVEDAGQSHEIDTDDDIVFLCSLDPKEWQKQDHYKVLGLSKVRHLATEDDIRRAYRLKVLKHHPDKRFSDGKLVATDDDDYFTCITRAYETLSDPARRVSYDSVDPLFDDSIPDKVPPEQFFKVFESVFARNARWSVNRKVPGIGTADSSRKEVDHFYDFWYRLDSWREFSYCDNEAQERGENREERRFIEKQIKATRKERKRAENVRIRQLVDNAYNCDPRVQHFRNEDRSRKLLNKQKKADERIRRVEEEETARLQAEQKERLLEERKAEEQRSQQEEARRKQQDVRQRLSRGRQRLRQLCQQADYYAVCEAERVDHMLQLERLCTMLDSVQLDSLNEGLEAASDPRVLYLEHVETVRQQIISESNNSLKNNLRSDTDGKTKSSNQRSWSHDELQTLIKAVRIFPAGTKGRWEVVANYLTQHVAGSVRTAKDVLERAKHLQHSDQQLKVSASELAYRGPTQSDAPCNGGISERTETPMDQQGSNSTPWSPEEHKLLEQALKTHGPQTPARWDQVAQCIPNRTKKDCMRRYRDLVELVKSKKAAKSAVNGVK